MRSAAPTGNLECGLYAPSLAGCTSTYYELNAFHRHTSDENVPLKEPFISLSLSSTDNVACAGRDIFTNKSRMEGVAM